jgi:phosphoserine aminotransferase
MFEDFKVPNELVPSDPRFGVGPSLVPIKTISELLKTGSELLGTSHRKPAIIELVKELHLGFRRYFSLPEDYEIIIGNGGATFFFDMIGTGLVEKSSVHFTTGEFSTKWFKAHAKIPWVHATQKSCEYGDGINPEIVEGHDMICATLNETSTGVLINSIPDVTQSDTLLAVDATSGAGQIKINMNKVDCYFFSPQKVFAGEGGLYVAFLSPKAVRKALRINKQERYIPEIMNWEYAIEKGRLYQTYNTPSITNLFMINEQLKRMNELGENTVIELAKKKARLIYDWASSKEYLSAFVKEENFRSHAVATIDLDEKYSVDDLLLSLRNQKLVYDIEGYRKLGRNQFRISLFHNISYDDLVKLTKIISLAVESIQD